ncbi:MAG TPA: GNAT family N-acetyltransferase [Candidatus Acidoferrales bacterium]|nr:GNAT family N-acetyltransferase [Candidatus Acidoferrales bacterium]
MTPPVETPRLFLRPLELADAEQIQVLFPRWEIVQYLANRVPWPYPPDGALVYIREMALPAVARGEAWHWTIRLKEKREQMIGFISLMKSEEENRGFWLDTPYRGRGLMTEACDAVTDFWFNVLKFPMLRAPKAVANEASRRISEKQCMRVISRGERDYVSGRLPSEVWEITAAEWRARKPASRPRSSA